MPLGSRLTVYGRYIGGEGFETDQTTMIGNLLGRQGLAGVSVRFVDVGEVNSWL